MQSQLNGRKVVVPLIYKTLESIDTFDHDTIYTSLSNCAQENGYKSGQVLGIARVALSGKEVTPGGSVELAQILGKQESLRRLQFSMDLLNK